MGISGAAQPASAAPPRPVTSLPWGCLSCSLRSGAERRRVNWPAHSPGEGGESMRVTSPVGGQELATVVSDLELMAEKWIGRLPDLSDDELLQTKQQAHNLGKAAWRIECAADAEIARRNVTRGDKKTLVDQAAAAS